MLTQKIIEDMKSAMKAKDKARVNVLRGLMTAFTNELVAKGRKPQDALSDEEAVVVISRAAKQRQDSIEQYEKGGRDDLAQAEKMELEIIREYLPEMMGEEEVRVFALQKRDEMVINSKEKFGQLMGAVMAGLKGRADGQTVKKVVEEILN